MELYRVMGLCRLISGSVVDIKSYIGLYRGYVVLHKRHIGLYRVIQGL